jgi:hypothetical protein
VNLDSLMDALTNVVAVLILVLILVQADVTKKVVEFLQDLQPATPEQVEQSRIDLATITNDLETRRKLMEKDPPSPEEIEEEKRLLSLLEKKIKDNTALLADLDALRKLEATLRKSRDAEQKETRHIQDEIARLEALLDATPVLEVPPPAEVTIPRSRPIPKTAADKAGVPAGVPAGWDVRGNTFYRFTIPEVEVRRLKEPPPPDPNAKPPAPRPPPLKPKLD